MLLDISLYSKIFLYLIDRKEFAYLLQMLERTPAHVTNAEKILAQIKPLLAKRAYKNDDMLLRSLFHLYKMKFEYENAFYAILKMRDNQIFDFLEQH